jgi:hypothetical protein
MNMRPLYQQHLSETEAMIECAKDSAHYHSGALCDRRLALLHHANVGVYCRLVFWQAAVNNLRQAMTISARTLIVAGDGAQTAFSQKTRLFIWG